MKALLQPQPGHAALSINRVAGQSAVTEWWSFNPLKLLVPRPRGSSVWVYLSSFGGGLVQGDQTNLSLQLGPGACCFLSTQASTKVYRNPSGRGCGHQCHALLQRGSLLILAPDPVQAFADSSYTQRQEFHLDPDAGLVLLDWYSSGRAARGERWQFERLAARNDVFLGGKRCLIDSMMLDRASGPLADTFRLGRFNCVAMVFIIGRQLASEAAALLKNLASQPIVPRSGLVYSISPLAGGVILRIAGEQAEEVARFVYHSLQFVIRFLEDDPWKRKLHLPENN